MMTFVTDEQGGLKENANVLLPTGAVAIGGQLASLLAEIVDE